MLGLPHDAEVAFSENPFSFFMIEDEAEMLAAATQRAQDVGVQPRWIVLGTGKSDRELLLDAVQEHEYHLVIDDLDPIDIGSRIGRLRRVTDQLTSGAGGTAVTLLTEAPCDVGIVVDAVNVRLIPAERLGAWPARLSRSGSSPDPRPRHPRQGLRSPGS